MAVKNSFGSSITLTLFGESHGPAVGAVLDGLCPGLSVDEETIAALLSRRRPSSGTDTARREPDTFRLLSGVWQGRTTGTPLCILRRCWARPGPLMRILPPTANIMATRMQGAAGTFPAGSPQRW